MSAAGLRCFQGCVIHAVAVGQDNFSACRNNDLGEKQDSFSAESALSAKSKVGPGQGAILSTSRYCAGDSRTIALGQDNFSALKNNDLGEKQDSFSAEFALTAKSKTGTGLEVYSAKSAVW